VVTSLEVKVISSVISISIAVSSLGHAVKISVCNFSINFICYSGIVVDEGDYDTVTNAVNLVKSASASSITHNRSTFTNNPRLPPRVSSTAAEVTDKNSTAVRFSVLKDTDLQDIPDESGACMFIFSNFLIINLMLLGHYVTE